jgi:hypothetical protein
VLQIFKDNYIKLLAPKAEECEKEVKFLRVIVRKNKVHMLNNKVKAVKK